MSCLFASGGQSIGASASVLPMYSGLISFINDITVIEVDVPTANAKEVEIEQFYEDLHTRPYRTNTKKQSKHKRWQNINVARYGESGALGHCGWECKMVQSSGKQDGSPSKN